MKKTISFMNKKSQKFDVIVEAETNEEAHEVVRSMFGYETDFTWLGTGPYYEGGTENEKKLITLKTCWLLGISFPQPNPI